MLIKNASNFTLQQNVSTLPQMSAGFDNFFQTMIFNTLVNTIVNFKVVQTPTPVEFQGVLLPFTPEQLLIKPEGQRQWIWYKLFARTPLVLVTDEVVGYFDKNYRVMQKYDYTEYDYVEYELIEDYTGVLAP